MKKPLSFHTAVFAASWLLVAAYGCSDNATSDDDDGGTGAGAVGGGAGVGAGGVAGTLVGTGGTTGGSVGTTGGTSGASTGGTGLGAGMGGSTAGSGVGGSFAGSGVGGSAAGSGPAGTGGVATGGSAGAATGGSAGTGTGTGGTGGANNDPLCKGIKSNMACPNQGVHCENLVCGLADSGRRTCDCATNWTCTSCDFTGSPFQMMPSSIMPCASGVMDKVACTGTPVNTVCGPVGTEYCACYLDDESAQIWDCDRPPWGT